MDKEYFQIEEVAEKTGLTKRTLRYYEDIELINPLRTEASYRLYSEEDIGRVRRIIEIKDNLGFCLGDIKVVLELDTDLKAIFAGKTRDSRLIHSSIESLKKHIDAIEKKEQSLKRSKAKCVDALAKLTKLYGEVRGVEDNEEN